MNIRLNEISVRDLVDGYKDSQEDGVVAYGGRLDVRPPYQREFIYKVKQRNAVIETVMKGFPLNVMYWAVRDDGGFEIIDGQQRTISLCQYAASEFSVDGLYIHNLPQDKRDRFLDYKLMIYQCTGTASEKLEWFKTINIAGERLTDQELRNAVYSGSWVTDAKRYFSKTGCPAYAIGSDYLTGSPIRQDYLETAIRWINKGNIEDYMSQHQHDPNAQALWQYYQAVIAWVQGTFTKKRTKFMKGVDWGSLYNKYKDKVYNTDKLEAETKRLILDDDVQNKKGIYPYLLTGDESNLNIRTFSDAQKHKAYETQGGKCAKCGKEFDISEMEGDHITPWREGGKTDERNLQLLCREDNRRKGVR